MRSAFLMAALMWGCGAISAHSQNLAAKQSEQSGQMSADLGASLFEVGTTREGGSTYIAHGYAAPQTKTPDASDPSKVPGATLVGEFTVRVGNLCVSSAAAQVVPLGWMGSGEPSATSGSDGLAYITGVKVDAEERPKGTCTYVLHVTYGAKLPASAKLTQIAYTMFLTGITQTPDSKPTVLPPTPL
jgi:hypothetical protein